MMMRVNVNRSTQNTTRVSLGVFSVLPCQFEGPISSYVS